MLRALSLSIILPLMLLVSFAHAQFQVPALTSPVMDEADVIDSEYEAALNKVIRDLRDTTGTQLNVLTVQSLNGLPIEQASIQVTDRWKLGNSKEDKGALLMIAMQERKMRIEVGQGLEGVIPDAIAKRIIDERMAPLMKAGRISEAVLLGVASIAEYSDPGFDFGSRLGAREKHASHRELRGRGNGWIWLLLLFFFIFLRPRGRRSSGIAGAMLGYGLGRSTRGWGGGGGGFGGGGGGWGGGGGGFSGGGASGGW